MLYKQELCNLNNPKDAQFCLEVAGLSLKNSVHTLIGGLPSGHFFDIDEYLCEKNNPEKLSDNLAQKINYLEKDKKFNKVAFIDKGGLGPVGLIMVNSLVSKLIKMKTIIVRPRKKLWRGVIKGNFEIGDNVLILNDVATTGRTVFEAVEKVIACGGKVTTALVVIDRDQGATINLARKGIELFSLFSAKTLREKKLKDLNKQYKVGIDDAFDPKLIDFGGRSITSIS